MGVRDVVARIISHDQRTVVIECRHCGESVAPDTDTDTCPACGATELARYELDR